MLNEYPASRPILKPARLFVLNLTLLSSSPARTPSSKNLVFGWVVFLLDLLFARAESCTGAFFATMGGGGPVSVASGVDTADGAGKARALDETGKAITPDGADVLGGAEASVVVDKAGSAWISLSIDGRVERWCCRVEFRRVGLTSTWFLAV